MAQLNWGITHFQSKNHRNFFPAKNWCVSRWQKLVLSKRPALSNSTSTWRLLTVLVDEHSYGDSVHVEPVEEILDVGLHVLVDRVRLLEFHHATRSHHDDVRVAVADVDQRLVVPECELVKELAHISSTSQTALHNNLEHRHFYW